MNLVPYTLETYFSLLSRFNEALWPLHVLALIMVLALGVCIVRKELKGCYGFLILASFWFFLGGIYYRVWLVELTWAAEWFKFACYLQGLFMIGAFLYIRTQVKDLKLDLKENLFASRCLIILALIYPFLAVSSFYQWDSFPMVAMTPISVILITMAILCQLRFGLSFLLGVVPFSIATYMSLESFELELYVDLIVIIAPLLWMFSMINVITRPTPASQQDKS